MSENNENQKEQIKTLENDIKMAYKESRFDDISSLADKLKAIDPENRVAVKIMEKIEKTKSEDERREKAGRIKEYDKMFSKLYKENNFKSLKDLIKELRNFAPEENKMADKWQEKTEKAEADQIRKQNADRIKDLGKEIDTAFKNSEFEEVTKIADKIRELDPENKTANKLVSKIEDAKKEAVRKENADKINALQDQIKMSFKETRFDDLDKSAEELMKIDPENKFALKYLSKSAKIKEKAGKAEFTGKAVKEELVKEENKESFWSKLFKKKEKTEEAEKQPIQGPVSQPIEEMAVKKEAPEPKVQPMKEITAQTQTEVKAEDPVQKDIDVELEDKGNVFTRMFKKKEIEAEEAQKSIIDTIVAKSSEKKKEDEVKIKEKKVKKHKDAVAFVGFSKAVLQFSVAFIAISAAFFYVQNIDANNTVLSLFGIQENNASRLHSAAELLNDKKADKNNLSKEINQYKEGYNTRYEETINSIIDKRLNWPDILEKINEITDFVYERNAISQYVQYSSYSFDAEKGTVSVNGTLSDPLGKNLQKLAELEEAFRYYPAGKDSSENGVKPYFYEVKEFNSLSKSYDSRTGKYTSSFQLAFSLQPVEEN